MLGIVTSAPSQSHQRRIFLCFLLCRKALSGRESVTHKGCSALLRGRMRTQKCSAFDPAFTPCSICTEGLNCSASRSETLQHCLVMHWCEPPAPSHPAPELSKELLHPGTGALGVPPSHTSAGHSVKHRVLSQAQPAVQ